MSRRGGGSRKEPSREVAVSKALSLILRHAAEKEGVKIDSHGYANVAELVCDQHACLEKRGKERRANNISF